MTSSIPQVAQYLDSIERTDAKATVLRGRVMTPHIHWTGKAVPVPQAPHVVGPRAGLAAS